MPGPPHRYEKAVLPSGIRVVTEAILRLAAAQVEEMRAEPYRRT